MPKIPVILIFDVGKTNKKIILFDRSYKIHYEESTYLPETIDEDGFPCEDIDLLTRWIKDGLQAKFSKNEFEIKAINFSAYGASFVVLEEESAPLLPLYNYLKPYPAAIASKLYNEYGGENSFATSTASPLLGNLNSGLQLYRLKQEASAVFKKVKVALHLPQYLSFVLTGNYYSDITGIGCHTALWNFEKHAYHDWVSREGIKEKLAPIFPSDSIGGYVDQQLPVGVGLHDSSAALIPYMIAVLEPFTLISTGTWSISLNPFNQDSLTLEELKEDCLFYLSYKGIPIKASRLFAGNEHAKETKRISTYFNLSEKFYESIKWDPKYLKIFSEQGEDFKTDDLPISFGFSKKDLCHFSNSTEAYYALVLDIVKLQVKSTNFILTTTSCKKIFVDGGFSTNEIYMSLLARFYSTFEVYAASVPQASALGAALVMHHHWNRLDIPTSIVKLKKYNA
jgi:hypothetical protein